MEYPKTLFCSSKFPLSCHEIPSKFRVWSRAHTKFLQHCSRTSAESWVPPIRKSNLNICPAPPPNFCSHLRMESPRPPHSAVSWMQVTARVLLVSVKVWSRTVEKIAQSSLWTKVKYHDLELQLEEAWAWSSCNCRGFDNQQHEIRNSLMLSCEVLGIFPSFGGGCD